MHVEPRPDPHRAVLYIDSDHRVQRRAPTFWLPPVGLLDLPSIRIDLLAEIAGPAHQSDKHDRDLEIGTGTRRIAGEHAEPSGISVHLRSDGDFHGKIRDVRPRKEGIYCRCHKKLPISLARTSCTEHRNGYQRCAANRQYRAAFKSKCHAIRTGPRGTRRSVAA